ncbi:hypothetical protein [Paraburkholderia humisilvae]|uniref:Uncharacterized protein n=1 Tax=Paraburkholderia humisilvae TaxID=627669 RepID=A0A6J5DN67_9BURK|nr:hypothetical protein [Paraburkholderia humisilvae]CAB3754671.1 hypothetical protein LMG29542_02418 [Paraburkholderia humisilvae]
MSVIESMKEGDVRRGREYECTDDDFVGIVRVTEVGGGMVYYSGDADGFSVMREFVRAYRPYPSSKN